MSFNAIPENKILSKISEFTVWASSRENQTLLHENNKSTDQYAHPCSLISVFIIHWLESIVGKLGSCKISIPQLVLVVQKACLSLTMLEILKTGFLMTRPIYSGKLFVY